MKNNDLFTITVKSGNDKVREYVSDCAIVIAHSTQADETDQLAFNMSLNNSSDIKTTLMLLEAMEQAMQQILDSDPKLRKGYDAVQLAKANMHLGE